MKIYYNYQDFHKNEIRETSLAIGNFDGIHLGHQKIIEYAVYNASKNQLLSGIFTFRRHPKQFLSDAPLMILPLEKKLTILKKMGIKICVLQNPSKHFFSYSPDFFISEVLQKNLKARVISVGENFHFGKNASGNTQNLIAHEKKFGYGLNIVPLIKCNGEEVSSTRIRTAIAGRNFCLANQLIGRPEFNEATIIPGKQIGRKLGFPTINVSPSDLPEQENGVFAVRLWLLNREYFGLMNVGHTPTFEEDNKKAEIHLLNFQDFGFLYKQKIIVQSLFKIREEKKFSSPQELIKQIKNDLRFFRKWLKQ